MFRDLFLSKVVNNIFQQNDEKDSFYENISIIKMPHTSWNSRQGACLQHRRGLLEKNN